MNMKAETKTDRATAFLGLSLCRSRSGELPLRKRIR
jgi:hypothetical protein